MVRVGQCLKIDPVVTPVSLDELAKKDLHGTCTLNVIYQILDFCYTDVSQLDQLR